MTFKDTVLAAGLPIQSVNEIDGSNPVFPRALTDEEVTKYSELRLQYYKPAEYSELLQGRIDLQQLKDAYMTMVNRLEQIQAAGNPTNAQLVQAIKDEALYIERVMKVIRIMVT